MAQSLGSTLAAACVGLLAIPAAAQDIPQATWQAQLHATALTRVPRELSASCQLKSGKYVRPASLRVLRSVLSQSRPIRVLAIGSSSTVGVGASSPIATYPVRLEHDLEGFLKGIDVHMIPRGIGGEVARDAAERLKLEVADNRPDLVVWQVGTNDAIARVDLDDFKSLLTATVRWLKSKRIDVALIDPQYVEHLATDAHYVAIVKAIAEVAQKERVLLVNRYEAMGDLSRSGGNGTYLARDRFHLNDLGYKCMAEYAARAIVGGVLQADAERSQQQRPSPPPAN